MQVLEQRYYIFKDPIQGECPVLTRHIFHYTGVQSWHDYKRWLKKVNVERTWIYFEQLCWRFYFEIFITYMFQQIMTYRHECSENKDRVSRKFVSVSASAMSYSWHNYSQQYPGWNPQMMMNQEISMHHSRPRPIHHISTYHNKATTHLQHKVCNQPTNNHLHHHHLRQQTYRTPSTVHIWTSQTTRTTNTTTQISTVHTTHSTTTSNVQHITTHSTGQTYTHSTNNTSNSAKSLTNTVHTHTNSSNTNNTNTLTSFSTCGTHIHHNSKEMDGYSRMLWFQYEFRRSSI